MTVSGGGNTQEALGLSGCPSPSGRPQHSVGGHTDLFLSVLRREADIKALADAVCGEDFLLVDASCFCGCLPWNREGQSSLGSLIRTLTPFTGVPCC